jgi:TRAP-type C4-dicarboxylate transport system permease small subunit
MSDSKINEGVSINNGDTKTYRDYDKDLPDENVGGSVKLEEYIRPFELAGSLSLPIQVLTVIAAFFMLAVTALTTIDVTGRYIFNSPVQGGVELIEFMLGLLIFSALPLVSVKRAHITVELFDNFMSTGFKRYREVFVLIASAAMIGFITERMLSTGLEAYEAEDISMHLDLPMAPIYFALTALSAISVVVQIYMVWRYVLDGMLEINAKDKLV